MKATDFWDQQIVTRERHEEGWLLRLPVRLYVNESVSRRQPPLWPIDWLREYRGEKVWKRGLSIGCGGGELERAVVRSGLCEQIDAFDGSLGSLAVATREAAAEGMSSRIHYFAGDFNTIKLPRQRYDVVFCHQSLHHVARLERLFSQIRRTLTPDGTLYIDEYIGPSRFHWTPDKLAAQRAIHAMLPREWVKESTLHYPIEVEDPSEAIRSDEIIPNLEVGFEIEERRDYGGNVLAILVPAINWSAAPESLLVNLIEAEKALLTSGEESWYTVVMARPRKGARPDLGWGGRRARNKAHALLSRFRRAQ